MTFPNQKIKSSLKFVLNNPHSKFYNQKYKQADISDFNSLPFLTRQEIVLTPPLERLFVAKDLVTQWNVSSGTTAKGNPLIIPKLDHPDPFLDLTADILKQSNAKTILMLARLMRLNSRLREWVGHPKLCKYYLIFGDVSNLGLATQLSNSAEIDGIDTTPSGLDFFLPFLKETYNLSKIKFISLGGEFTSKERFKMFKSFFKKAYFHFRFGGAESPIYKGLRCQYLAEHMAPKFFHPNTDFYLYEILDQEGNSVPEGKGGELVLSTLKKCAFPLIRYKTGDRIIYYSQKCDCGRVGLIELGGRVGYDFVTVAGISIHSEIIEKALAQTLGKFENDYQLHIYEVIHKNRLMPKLVLQLNPKFKNIKNIAKNLEASLLVGSKLTLKKLVDQEIFLPLEVEFKDEWSHGYKSLKIIAHLD